MESLHKLCTKKNVPGEWKQFLVTCIVNLQIITCGLQTGWAAPTTPQLQSTNPPIGEEPMTDYAIGWLNGVGYLAALIVIPFCGNLSEHFGRKLIIYAAAILTMICSIGTAFSETYITLLSFRVIGAIGGAISIVLIPIYVCEISCEKTRAKNGSIFAVSLTSGIVIAYTMGDWLSYRTHALTSTLCPVIFLLLFTFIPETPVYLVRKSRIAEATRSLMWLKNNDKSCVDDELLKLEKVSETISTKLTGWRYLFRDRASTQGFVIAICLLFAQVLSGISIVVTYAVTIFQQIGSSMRPNSAAIVVASMQVIPAIPFTLIIEYTGRRPMIFISSIVMTIALFILGIFSFVQMKSQNLESVEWIPIVALSIYVIAYCFGVGPVPYIIIVEVFHPDIVSYASSFCCALSLVVTFIYITIYPYLIQTIHYHGCFFLFAFSCLFICLFTWLFVPETKDRRIESIVNELNDSWIFTSVLKQLKLSACFSKFCTYAEREIV